MVYLGPSGPRVMAFQRRGRLGSIVIYEEDILCGISSNISVIYLFCGISIIILYIHVYIYIYIINIYCVYIYIYVE